MGGHRGVPSAYGGDPCRGHFVRYHEGFLTRPDDRRVFRFWFLYCSGEFYFGKLSRYYRGSNWSRILTSVGTLR